MLKILVDGVEIPVKPLNDVVVVWEFDPQEYEDHAQIQHKFTHEGVMVSGVTDGAVMDLSHREWEQLSEDAGFE